MIDKNIQINDKVGGFSAMSMDWAAQQKKQELEMKKKVEGEPDLGYVGAFSGMRCGELKETGDRLECHYSKYKYDDPLAKMEARKKALQRKRQGRHKYAIQRMCMEESPFLCATKDRDDLPKDKDPKCMELKACPEPLPKLEDIWNDSKEFYKLIVKAISFGKSKKKKRAQSTKELSKLRKKMKKELDEIEKEYDSLLKPGAAPGSNKGAANQKGDNGSVPPAPSAPPAKGGSLSPNIVNNIYKAIVINGPKSPINPMEGGAIQPPAGDVEMPVDQTKKKNFGKVLKETFISSDKTFGEQTGTSSCKGKVARGVFKKDWKNYQKCVLDYMEGAPKDGASLIEETKKKFSSAPLIPRHLQLLEKYDSKKKLMEKTTSSASQKVQQLKRKIKGKLAAYKVAGQKAKNSAKKMGKSLKMTQDARKAKLEEDPELKGKVNEEAKERADKKLADLNAKRASKGQLPLSEEDAKIFLDKQQTKEFSKIVASKGVFSKSSFGKIKKDLLKNRISNQKSKLGIGNDVRLKTTSKTLKRLQKAQNKIERFSKLKGKNGIALGDKAAKNLVIGGIKKKK